MVHILSFPQFRVFTAPFHRVEFADFWLADQLNSLVIVLSDLEYLVCYYSMELKWGDRNGLLPTTYGNWWHPKMFWFSSWHTVRMSHSYCAFSALYIMLDEWMGTISFFCTWIKITQCQHRHESFRVTGVYHVQWCREHQWMSNGVEIVAQEYQRRTGKVRYRQRKNKNHGAQH